MSKPAQLLTFLKRESEGGDTNPFGNLRKAMNLLTPKEIQYRPRK